MAGRVVRDVDEIVDRFRQALAQPSQSLAARDVLDELVRQPSALEATLGSVVEGGIQTLHRAPDLTVLQIAWTPGISLFPHEHRMWAVVGMYGGQEDNVFYRRSGDGLQQVNGRELRAGEVLVMGEDAIHAVSNTRREYAVAIHVYGGDFFDTPRSEWDPETFAERPRDVGGIHRVFDAANAAFRAPSD